MDKVISKINFIKEQKSIAIRTIYTLLSDLQDEIKDELHLRLRRENLHSDFTPVIERMLFYWTYPIKWEIVSEPYLENSTTESGRLNMSLFARHQLLIFTNPNDIESDIESFVEELKGICGNRLMNLNEKALIHNLHNLYTNMNRDDKEDVKKLITRNFNVEYVECKDEFDSVEYFDPIISDVEQPETRVEAMISKYDNSCIDRGVFLHPRSDNDNLK